MPLSGVLNGKFSGQSSPKQLSSGECSPHEIRQPGQEEFLSSTVEKKCFDAAPAF